MSHIVQLQTQVKDAAAIRAACQRLGLPEPVQGTTKLFSGEVEGLAISLPRLDLSRHLRYSHWSGEVRQLQWKVGRSGPS